MFLKFTELQDVIISNNMEHRHEGADFIWAWWPTLYSHFALIIFIFCILMNLFHMFEISHVSTDLKIISAQDFDITLWTDLTCFSSQLFALASAYCICLTTDSLFKFYIVSSHICAPMSLFNMPLQSFSSNYHSSHFIAQTKPSPAQHSSQKWPYLSQRRYQYVKQQGFYEKTSTKLQWRVGSWCHF